MPSYFVVSGKSKSLRQIGNSSETKKGAIDRANKYHKKYPQRSLVVMTIRRVKKYKPTK
jgi:hypothetical protein